MILDDTGWRRLYGDRLWVTSLSRVVVETGETKRPLSPDPWIAAGTCLVLSDNHLDIKEADFDE